MQEALESARRRLASMDCIVVKVGSQQLVIDENFDHMAQGIAALMQRKKRVVLVSSGAIALGLSVMGLLERPKDLPSLQAAAATGQMRLMQRWSQAFAALEVPVAQVLLTHGDLASRRRYLNARAAMERLLEAGVLPIVNENDTVSVEEIKLGDNDALAAETCGMTQADLLVLLTNTDGLFTKDPTLHSDAERIPFVTELQELDVDLKNKSSLGTGGMGTKLEAVRIAQAHGASCVIARPSDEVLTSIVEGADVGTLFVNKVGDDKGAKESARKRWIALTLRPKGTLFLDEGAHRALTRGASVLAVGVVNVEGDFDAGDCVDVVYDDVVVARGLCALNGVASRRVQGLQSDAFAEALSESLSLKSGVLIHRNDLVLM